MKPHLIKKAFDLGYAGYAKGIMAPVHDKAMMKIVEQNDDKRIGASTLYLDAWCKGKAAAHREATYKEIDEILKGA